MASPPLPLVPLAAAEPERIQHRAVESYPAPIERTLSERGEGAASTTPSSSRAPPSSAERTRLSAQDMGRIAEKAYQLLFDRIVQERQRRGP